MILSPFGDAGINIIICIFQRGDQESWRFRTLLVVQWLRLQAPDAGGPGSFPGQGARSAKSSRVLGRILPATTKDPVRLNKDRSVYHGEDPVQPNQ